VKRQSLGSRKDLKHLLQYERNVYFEECSNLSGYRYRKTLKYEIYKYICLLRQYEYACQRRDSAKTKVSEKYWAWRVKKIDRRKNRQGQSLCVEISPNAVAKGIKICHQNVVINGIVGENCVFHGNNVLGNKRTGAKNETPVLGNNVDVGVGAIIIGKVQIADDCVIGAGAVVTKSFLKPGTIIAGVPAKEIANKG
jgi:serine O-acetyltransferase